MTMPEPHARGRLRHDRQVAVGILTAALTFGCQILFGDFSVEDDQGEGGASESLGGSGPGSCVEGRTRCDGANLLRCDGESFVLESTCADANHCDETGGTCRSCLEGQTRCGDAALEECSESGEGYVVVQACTGDTPLCDPVLLRCVACTRGAARCTNGQLESCNDARQWTLTACANGCEDVTGDADYCRQCTEPGSASCTTEGNLITCSEAYLWLTEVCAGTCVTDGTSSYCAASG
jgi:hypothetical protein